MLPAAECNLEPQPQRAASGDRPTSRTGAAARPLAEAGRSGVAHDLGIVLDLHHPSYKVVGLLTWLTLGAVVGGALAFPHALLTGARVFALYILIRLIANVFTYAIGLSRCRAWQTGDKGASEPEAPASDRYRADDVHHVVVIPNYEEPVGVLCRTLEALAAQRDARQRLSVVLAMEEREAGASAKGRELAARFGARFAHFLVTFHPANLPGEIPCKGSNQAWAARQARRELVEQVGLPVEHLTLTVCDADSVLHPRYFAELTWRFASDPKRHLRFWHAPLLFHNNIWEVPAPIRLLAISNGVVWLAELSNPLSWPLPVSTYTLSFKLAEDVGYWDPAVISEDWHMYLRCFFATQGQVSLKPMYLPTSLDAVEGRTALHALASYFRQQVRHGWGAEDVGYILQQWRRSPAPPLHKRLLCLWWVLHSHWLRANSWVILGLGSLLSGLFASSALSVSGRSPRLDPVWTLNILGAVSSLGFWAVERARCKSRPRGRRILALAQEIVTWTLLPTFGFTLGGLPGLIAQTKLLLGLPLHYRRTPKGLRSDGRGETSP